MAALYGAACVIAHLIADRVIFLPPPPSYADDRDVIKVRSAGGVAISARYLANPSARYTLLYSHGNAEDLGLVAPLLAALRDAGFSVFAYDYRGYGTSAGRPSERGAYADIDAAYAHLTNVQGVPAARVIAYGRSVGSGPAIDLASRQPVAGLVVESGFTTAFAVLTRYPLLLGDRFRNIQKIGRVRCPVLVMHGVDDEIVPASHGRALWRAAPEPKRFLWVDGAGHNDVWLVAKPRLARALTEFADMLGDGR